MISSSACAQCGTELADALLACPACGTLRHGERLRELAARADTFAAAGAIDDARGAWEQALALVPRGARQHGQIASRIAALTAQAAEPAASEQPVDQASHPWWKRGAAAAVAGAGLLVGKAKFLALGLLKAKTLFSMLAFVGVYWTAYGWPLAVGIAASIYIHEMGHVAALRQLGIAADAPLFIPGVGALILLRQHIDDPAVDAKIGLAGPLWGLGAGLGALLLALVTGRPTLRAIAELTGFINLFNLTPIWQLDGSRGFHALSRQQRAFVVATIGLAFMATGQRLLILVGAVALFRAFQANETPGDSRTFATFVFLIVALSWLSRQVG